MTAQSFVLENPAEKAARQGPLLRRFLRRVSPKNVRWEGSPTVALAGMEGAAGAWSDLAWPGEQRFIESKHRALGHM